MPLLQANVGDLAPDLLEVLTVDRSGSKICLAGR